MKSASWSTTSPATRDPVDEIVDLGSRLWRFVDTAGIRRRVHLQRGAELLRVAAHVGRARKAEVAVVVLDVSEQISEADVRIIDPVRHQVGPRARARVQQVGSPERRRSPNADRRPRARDRRTSATRRVRAYQHLGAHRSSPQARARARSGSRLMGHPHPRPTCGFNVPVELVAEHPHPLRGGKQPRILFGTQALDASADVRPVHDRLPRPGLPSVHPAPPARDLGLRRSHRRQHARARGSRWPIGGFRYPIAGFASGRTIAIASGSAKPNCS